MDLNPDWWMQPQAGADNPSSLHLLVAASRRAQQRVSLLSSYATFEPVATELKQGFGKPPIVNGRKPILLQSSCVSAAGEDIALKRNAPTPSM
jgi:hypothetical protein